MTRLRLTLILAVPFLLGADWLQFRGNDCRNVADGGSEMKRAAWKASLPGRGPSGPIVIGGRVVVTAASGARQAQLHTLCFDAAEGKLLWQRRMWATGSTIAHDFGGLATPTPASDGKRIYVFYATNDLACFDLDGNLKWLRGLGFESPSTRNDNGMASSPLVVGQTVIVQCETQGASFAMGLDSTNGLTRWRIDRDPSAIWSSPTVLTDTKGEKAVLLQGRSKITAHDPQTGRQLWQYEAPCHTIASATTEAGVVYLPAIGLHAIQVDPLKGVSKLWYEDRLRSENSSPVVADGKAYVIKSPGILMAADTATGKVLWQLRLTGPFWATPLKVGNRLICVNHAGLVQVVALAETGEVTKTMQIDEGILASPVAADGALYFRSDKNLWKMPVTMDR